MRMTTAKFFLTLFFTYIITVGFLQAQNENSIEGDFQALQELYNSTKGSGVEILNSVSDLPAPDDATYPFMYIINNEIHALSKERIRAVGSWVNHGAIWKDKTGWDTMTPETMGDAVGVEVDSNGRVVVLDMQKITTEPFNNGTLSTGNGLIGTLPPEIGNLKKIKRLNVKQNFFHGAIPDVFDGWNDLERWSIGGINWELNVDDRREWHEGDHLRVNYDDNPFTHSTVGKKINATNSFNSTLPLSLDGLPKLELIEGAFQFLKGPLPAWGNMPSIKGIYIPDIMGPSSVTLGEIPSSWGNLTTMQVFQVANYHTYPRFSGQLPDGVKDWTNLANFALINNNFSGALPQFTGFTDLVYFNIGGLEFTGEFPWSSIFNGNNARLSKFGIASNNFSGSLPATIPAATHPSDAYPNYRLDAFSIDNNNFDGDLPDWVSKFTNLQIINIAYNNFTGSFPAELLNRPILKAIYLQGNNLSGTLPEGTWATERVRWFRIDGNNFEGEIPDGWESLLQASNLVNWTPAYQRYRFENNNLSGRVPDWGKNVSWGRNKMYSFQGNRYTFKDILPVYDELKTFFGDNFKITNQKPFGEPVSRSMPEGAQLIIDLSDVHYEGNSYQWLKDGEPITGAISHTYEIQSVSLSDEGDYVLEVSNLALPELGVHASEPIQFRIGEDDGQNNGSGDDGSSNEGDDGSGNENDENDSGDNNEGDGSRGSGQDDEGPVGSPVFPEAPVHFGPNDKENHIDLTPTITWSSVEGADYYILHMSRNNPGGMVLDVITEDTTYTHPEILGEHSMHYWRVKAVKAGEEGEWSGVWSFRTEEAELPGMANLISPVNLSENIELLPELVWEEIEADSYRLRILEKESGDVLQSYISTASTIQIEEMLQSETEYVWQVKSVLNGIEGAWGPRWEFSTGDYEEGGIEIPLLVAPNRGTEYETLQPQFEWTDSGADHYILSVHVMGNSHAKSNTLLQIPNSIIFEEVDGQTFVPAEQLEPGIIYYWKVKAVKGGEEGDWSEQWEFLTPRGGTTVSSEPGEVPLQTEIGQNYPNPFNPTTQIEFTLSSVQNVSLRVYDMAGRQVANLVDGVLQAGRHNVTFDASNLASGIYIYRLLSDKHQFTRKMTLVK